MKESLYSKLLNLFQLDSYFRQGALEWFTVECNQLLDII